MTSYYEKIVVTKGIAEVWRYEKLNTTGGGSRDGDGENKEKNYRDQQKRRRNRIRQLICANFDSNSKFITLTFDNDREFDICNVQACNRYFKRFIQRLKYRFPELQYVAVIEFQDKRGRGAVHYHMICNLGFVPNKVLRSIWGGGHVKINAIDKVDNVGAYVIKYMCKDTEDVRLMGEHAYLHSKGLEEPQIFCTWGNSQDWESWHSFLQKESPSYSAKYESDNAGHIEYFQYKNLNLNQS